MSRGALRARIRCGILSHRFFFVSGACAGGIRGTRGTFTSTSRIVAGRTRADYSDTRRRNSYRCTRRKHTCYACYGPFQSLAGFSRIVFFLRLEPQGDARGEGAQMTRGWRVKPAFEAAFKALEAQVRH